VLGALLLPGVAQAQADAPRAEVAQQDAHPPPEPDVARMAAVLQGQVGHAQLYYYGWSGFYGSVILAETIINATSTGGSRIAAQVNIVTSWVGLFEQLVLPHPVAFEWEPVSLMPDGTPEQQAAKSAAIRALFERELQKERFYHSVWNHLFGLVVNAGVCAFMYWGQHLGGRALLNLFGGSLIWEANIFTSPNATLNAADNAQAGIASLRLVPVAVGAQGVGLGVAMRF
jgi:hypothetical protein